MTRDQLILAIIQRRRVIAREVKECDLETEDTTIIDLAKEFDFLRKFQFQYSDMVYDQEHDCTP